MEKTREEILKVLRSGNFTIYFHDSDENAWDIYDTFVDSGEIEDWEEFDKLHKIYEPKNEWSNGYISTEVQLLVDALGGKTGTT